MATALQTMTNELTHVFLLSVGAFLLAMFLTPIYTFFAYRYRFWKRQRSESTDGKELKVFAKFQAAKLRRNIPTMAGVIGVISIFVVTNTRFPDFIKTLLIVLTGIVIYKFHLKLKSLR